MKNGRDAWETLTDSLLTAVLSPGNGTILQTINDLTN